ncbi:MAG: methylated-DNA--[protein]-cysteine S-methyltransferase [Anaerolineae bacterium]|nr:methylated-DNA--[protein]-cysteine S-methyltransferase [Anaerolineae bacterium]
METVFTIMPSPLGELLLARHEEGVTFVEFHPTRKIPEVGWRRDEVALADVVSQLSAYFAGERREFDLPLAPQGTPFQLRVWAALETLPYGETISYGELARQLGDGKAVRAVGAANGRNPIAIIIPCHRVIGSDGSLIGYGGGLERKEALLLLERHGRSPLIQK